ncbi:MAG: bifunctional phosphoglucose/phosphomannose isomerase [Candidatus Xenobia bacterium]
MQQPATNPNVAAMIEMLRGFPAQCEAAVAIGRDFDPGRHEITNIVMTGLGGSAIGADLLRAYVASSATVPVQVNRDYELPAFVNERTLVLAISYSGNTEETLAAWQDARARGAQIVTFTTGGTLARESAAAGVSCCRVPGGLQPRAALGFSFFPLLLTLEKLGVVPPQATAIEDALRIIRQATAHYASEENLARDLAQRLEHRVPLIYGSWNAVGVVAYRWKSQINENAKGIAFWNTFPELNHNETVGWSGRAELCRDLGVVLLRTPSDPPRIRRRMDLTRSQIEAQAPVNEVTAEGAAFLAQLFSLVVLGDWMSLYLALYREQDPVAVYAIDAIKKALAEG